MIHIEMNKTVNFKLDMQNFNQIYHSLDLKWKYNISP